MVAKDHAFHATFNVHREFSDINLDLGGPLSSRESLRYRIVFFRCTLLYNIIPFLARSLV